VYSQEYSHLASFIEFPEQLTVIKKIDSAKPGIFLLHKKMNNKSAYEIRINKNKIVILGEEQGIFYGIITLNQLMHQESELANMMIKDEPQYEWRGMHLDVSRHFFSVDFIKKYIDILAMHKMNVFHWHLTDDQGWRIEIKKYPKLATIASQRKETMTGKNFEPYQGDHTPHSGYYTQEQIKEVVDYAQKRMITIVPEIEMPGHSVAALSAYPQLSCNGSPLESLTKWGVSDDVFCTKQECFQFLFDVLDEVLVLFPSQYIHIGGDEVPKTRWKTCAHCQGLMKERHLDNENELQSYFITRIDSFLTSRGRSTIGWDEILEGGLAPNAAVMSWRGEAGGIEAASKKHKVVMCPGSHCYFDHYQGARNTEPLAIGGYTTVQKVYSYNPVASMKDNESKQYVLGAQGNVWTEYISTEKHAEYMALPRLCALSEVLWGHKTEYEIFATRLINHFNFLEAHQINYAKNIFDINSKYYIPDYVQMVQLSTDAHIGEIKYTLDGTSPNATSKSFKENIIIDHPLVLKAQLFNGDEALGNLYTQKYVTHLATGKSPVLGDLPSTRYMAQGYSSLVDGVIGELPWTANEWLGWDKGHQMNVTIDLKKSHKVNRIRVSLLDEAVSWIHLPSKLRISVYDTALKETVIADMDYKELKKMYASNKIFSFPVGKYIRTVHVRAIPLKEIPEGNPGAGEDPWIFCSEILVEE
jgi:hexosaminidase